MNEADLDHLLPEFRAAALLPDSERIVRVRSGVGSITESPAPSSPSCRRSSISRRAAGC